MTDSQLPKGQDDLSAAPEYKQLGEEGNPLSGSDTGIDQVPAPTAEPVADADAADLNAPLPDWGPTDGVHGVDGSDPDA